MSRGTREEMMGAARWAAKVGVAVVFMGLIATIAFWLLAASASLLGLELQWQEYMPLLLRVSLFGPLILGSIAWFLTLVAAAFAAVLAKM